jgi:hypothetical protein
LADELELLVEALLLEGAARRRIDFVVH